MTSTSRARTRVSTGTAACAAALLAWGSIGAWAPTDAHAVPVVGADSMEDNATATTHTLQITLARGNNNADGTPPTGQVDAVTIELQQLAGIDPNSLADLEKIHGTSLDVIEKQWEKSRSFRSTTDAEGTVLFEDLPRGIFLVTSTAPTPQHRDINSFLVAVPFHVADAEGHAPTGVIVAKPKPPVPPTTVLPPQPPTTVLPPQPPATSTPDEPGTPSEPDTPSTTLKAPPPATSTPDEPGTPSTGTPPSTGHPPSLAMTGVQLTGIVLAGLALIGAGTLIVFSSARRNRKA